MSLISEEIRAAVLLVLPSLPEETLSSLLEKLSSIGVECKSDLKLIKEEDLQEYLKPIQCRKLLQAWITEEEFRCATPMELQSENSCSSPVDISRSSFRMTSSSSSTPSPASTNSRSSTVDLNTWPDSFEVPWSKVPRGIKLAIANEQRPSPRDRREMIRIIVDEMRLFELNPTRSDCLTVAKMIVKQYPKSFADILKDGTRIGSGYASVVNQLKTRVKHLNRDSMIAGRRRVKGFSCSSSIKNPRGPADQYGCIRWQPDCPQGETEASLQVKQQEMKELYDCKGPSGAEKGHLTQLMETTYYLQRNAINAGPAPTIPELRSSWPYLFTEKGLYNHFKLLTDISILEKMEEAIKDRGMMILHFPRQKSTSEHAKAILSNVDATGPTVLVPCIVLLLMAYYKEKSDGLIFEVDNESQTVSVILVTIYPVFSAMATPADVERSLSLPDSPRLIFQGDIMTSVKWMISIEGQVVMSSHSNFAAGLAALFASFYHFNLEYQEEASCTLEFIQRCFMGINPTTGSKNSAKK